MWHCEIITFSFEDFSVTANLKRDDQWGQFGAYAAQTLQPNKGEFYQWLVIDKNILDTHYPEGLYAYNLGCVRNQSIFSIEISASGGRIYTFEYRNSKFDSKIFLDGLENRSSSSHGYQFVALNLSYSIVPKTFSVSNQSRYSGTFLKSWGQKKSESTILAQIRSVCCSDFST